MKKKLRNNIIVMIQSLLSIHIFLINLYKINPKTSITNPLYSYLYEFRLSLNEININTLFLLIIIYYFYKKALKYKKQNKEYNIFLSIILTLVTMIGKCYKTPTSSIGVIFLSLVQFYKFIILSIAYFIIYYNIINILSAINLRNITIKKTKFQKYWEKNPIIITMILILLCWLPYIIIFYPGGSTGDTVDSIFQFFHNQESWSINTINLLSSKVYINKHHSVLFTIILGLCIKVGLYFNSFDLGFYIFIIFQLLIVLSIFILMLYYFKKNNIPFWIIILSIIYICFSPIIIQYSLTAVKDTLSAAFTLLYTIFLLQIIKNYNSIFTNKLRLILLIITMLLVMMLRNNGIFTIILSFPFLILLYKEKRKKIVNVLLLVLIIFFSYNNILLPNLKVSNGSRREILSIPFMQLARTAKYHKEEFTKEEINNIDKVLDFENMINNYTPDISDGVKNLYKKSSTKQANSNLIKIWYKYLKKHPLIYIESFLNSTYKYFYPTFFSEDLNISKHYNLESEYSEPIYFCQEKDSLNSVLILKYKSIFTIYFTIVALIDWYLILVVIKTIKNKAYKYIIPLLPSLSILLVCLASPVNGCPRYILPIFFSLPIIIVINYLTGKK